MNALEEIGLTYVDHGLALMRGEQRRDEYLAINPKGKVPTLLIDGWALTENPAIIFYLASSHPDAGLLPELGNSLSAAQALSDLIWCGGTLQPIVGRLMRPALYSEKDAPGVHASAIKQFAQLAGEISGRLSNRCWWYGDEWSIVDVYLYWAYSVAAYAGFPLSDYPALEEHTARVRSRPSFERALQREKAAVIRDNIPLPPGAQL
jgi:glutathione S-transferase